MKRGRPFGEKKKEKDLIRKELARVRATAMEGSFGTQKEHYDHLKVKAGTVPDENSPETTGNGYRLNF